MTATVAAEDVVARLATRLRVVIDLRASEPIRPGSSIEVTDDPAPHDPPSNPAPTDKAPPQTVARVSRDDEGRPFLAGSTLAGCLSSLLERRLGRPVPELFGEVTDDTQVPSPLVVIDGEVRVDDEQVVTKARTPLDRQRGAAAHGLLHNAEQVEGPLDVRVRLELLGRAEESERALAELLDEVQVVGLRIGRSTRKGFGLLTVESIEIVEVDLNDPETFETWLLHRHDPELTPGAPSWETLVADPDQWIRDRAGQATLGSASGQRTWGGVRFELTLIPIEPVVVAPQLPAGADPPVPRRFEASRFVGALRTRAERIARTMAPEIEVWNPAVISFDRDVPDHADGIDTATDLFGSTGSAAYLTVEELAISDAVQQRFDGVAIDRFTGGAADELKFETLAVTSGQFRAVITTDGFEPRHIGLLTLLVGDLADGDLPVGRRTNSGFGRFRLGRLAVSVRGRDVPAALHPALAATPTPSDWSTVASAAFDDEPAISRAELLDRLDQPVAGWLRASVGALAERWSVDG